MLSIPSHGAPHFLSASRIHPQNEHSILKFEDETASLVEALWLHDRLVFSLGNFFYDEIASSRISRDEDVDQGCISRLQLNSRLVMIKSALNEYEYE